MLRILENVTTINDLPAIKSVSPLALEELVARLHKVPQYAESNISYTWIKTRDYPPLQTFAQQNKIKNIYALFEALKTLVNPALDLCVCPPLEIELATCEKRRIIPPLVEYNTKTGQRYVIDGTHRLYLSLLLNKPNHMVLCVTTNASLPADICAWNDVALVDAKPPTDKRYKNLKPEHFRKLKEVGFDG